MSNNIAEQEVSLKEIMKNADLGAGLNLDILVGEAEKTEEQSKAEPEKSSDVKKDRYHCYLPSMEINCDLQVEVGNKNKVIYVCPGKLQYFTANAVCCSGDESIEIEYCGYNAKCVNGEKVICGCLGYYKIVSSGIIFIPNHNLSEFPESWFPTDILPFKAKDKCDKDVEFVVVFTYSRCVDCECGCAKSCRS